MEKKELKARGEKRAFSLDKIGLPLFTVLVALLIGSLEHAFFKPDNLLNILSSACLTGIAGIGMTTIMATGETDFSVGSYMTASAVVLTVLLHQQVISNYYLALTLGLAAAILIGLCNAFLHIVVGIPSFIATVSMTYLVSGLSKWITKGSTIYKGMWDTEIYTFLGQKKLWGFFPMPLVVLLAVSIVVFVFTEMTRGGRYLYAVGTNSKACQYIGIDAKKQKLKGFLICAFLCGISGVVQASMSNGAGPYLGDTFFLQALMVVMLGATFKQGVFNVPGTIIGAILVTILSNGMTLLRLDTHARYIIQGLVLLSAVSIVAVIRSRVARTKV